MPPGKRGCMAITAARKLVLKNANKRRWELYRLKRAAEQNGTGHLKEDDIEDEEDIKIEVEVKEEVSSGPEDVDMEEENSFETGIGVEQGKEIKIESSEEPNRSDDDDECEDPLNSCNLGASRPFHFYNTDGADVDSDSQTSPPVVKQTRKEMKKYRRKTRILPQSDASSKMENQDELTLEIKRLKFSNPLSSLPNPNNSMEHHCLICYKMLIDIESESGARASEKRTGGDALHGNLNVMFILKKLLHVPSKDLEACLQHCGNPINWLRICAECQPFIEDALSLNDKLMEVVRQMDKCRELIVGQLRDSLRRNEEAFENSGICSTCDTDNCRGHPKYLTDKIRKFVWRKNYPVTKNPYEEGDQEAKDKSRLANLSFQNRLMRNVKFAGIGEEGMSSGCSWSGNDDGNGSPENPNATDECNRVSEEPNKDDNTSSFILNLLTLSKDMLAPITTADSMVRCSSADFSTKTYHCSACPDLPVPDGMNFNQFLCHITFHIKFPFRCSECNLFFPMNEATREQHWKDCHKDTQLSGEPFQIVLVRPLSMWDCFYCDETYSTEDDRETHFMEEHKASHKSTMKPYVCFHCPRMFYNKNERRLHIVIDQCSNANIYNCPVCETGFKRITAKGTEYLDESALYQHIDDEHPDEIVAHKLKACDFCGLVFQGLPNEFPGFSTHKLSTHGDINNVSNHVSDDGIPPSSLLNQHTSTKQVNISLRKSPLILRKTKKLSPGTQSHLKQPSLLMTSAPDNPTCVMSSSTLTMASQFLQAKSVASTPHEPSGSLLNQKNLLSLQTIGRPRPIVPLIFSKTVKKDAKTAVSSPKQASSMSTRSIKPKRTLFMSPPASTRIKKTVKVKTKTTSRLKIRTPRRKPKLYYSCATCPHLQPKRLYEFLKHIAFHQKRPNRCVECLVYLPKDEAIIAEHWSQFHNGCDKFPHYTEVAFNPKDIWDCNKCPETFSSIEDQICHERKAHGSQGANEEAEYTCATCSKNLYSFPELQLHRAVEHPQVAEISCFYCEATFVHKTKEGIELCDYVQRFHHVKNKHPNEEIKFFDPCHLCGMDFEAPRELNDHLMNFHSIPEAKLFQCPIPHCTFARGSRFTLRKHIEGVHVDLPQKYMCDNCGWSGKKIYLFHHHQFKYHGIVPDGVTVHACEFEGCSFQALRKCDIRKHALIHLPEKDRPFQCNICGKGFYDGKHFREHQEIHKNKESKPYQCEICGNSFAVKNYLYIHKRLSHQRRFFPSTHTKKPKRNGSKCISKTTKHSEATATSPDLVSQEERNHGVWLSDRLVSAETTTVAATTSTYVSLPDGSN